MLQVRPLLGWSVVAGVLLIGLACGADEGVPEGAGTGGVATGGSGALAGSGGGLPDGAAAASSGGGTSDAAADSATDAPGTDATSDAVAQLAPDFSLVDENPGSPLHQQLVSPRDYLGQVSAWYFGHAT